VLAYQWAQQLTYQWTRVDTVLALLEETVRTLRDLAASRTEEGAEPPERKWRRAELLLAGLISGVDVRAGEVAYQFLRLYEYVHYVVANRRRTELERAAQILDTLRSGFAAVREQAIELERQGVIPPAGTNSQCAITA